MGCDLCCKLRLSPRRPIVRGEINLRRENAFALQLHVRRAADRIGERCQKLKSYIRVQVKSRLLHVSSARSTLIGRRRRQ